MNTIQKLLVPLTIAVLMIGSAQAGTVPPAVTAIDTKSSIDIGEQIKNGGQPSSRIKVRFEHGDYQTVSRSAADLRVGDRVRVDNDQVSRDLKP
jgi:transcription elongation factor